MNMVFKPFYQAQKCPDTVKIQLELYSGLPQCIALAVVVLYMSLNLQMFWQGNIARVVYLPLSSGFGVVLVRLHIAGGSDVL